MTDIKVLDCTLRDGAFAYCTDDYLSRLPVPENLDIAVTVNAKNLVSGPGTSADVVDQMFLFAPAV